MALVESNADVLKRGRWGDPLPRGITDLCLIEPLHEAKEAKWHYILTRKQKDTDLRSSETRHGPLKAKEADFLSEYKVKRRDSTQTRLDPPTKKAKHEDPLKLKVEAQSPKLTQPESKGQFVCYVGGLFYKVNHSDLKKAFAEFQPIRARVKTDEEGRSLGYGYVELRSKETLDRALAKMQNAELRAKGWKLQVSDSNSVWHIILPEEKRNVPPRLLKGQVVETYVLYTGKRVDEHVKYLLGEEDLPEEVPGVSKLIYECAKAHMQYLDIPSSVKEEERREWIKECLAEILTCWYGKGIIRSPED